MFPLQVDGIVLRLRNYFVMAQVQGAGRSRAAERFE